MTVQLTLLPAVHTFEFLDNIPDYVIQVSGSPKDTHVASKMYELGISLFPGAEFTGVIGILDKYLEYGLMHHVADKSLWKDVDVVKVALHSHGNMIAEIMAIAKRIAVTPATMLSFTGSDAQRIPVLGMPVGRGVIALVADADHVPMRPISEMSFAEMFIMDNSPVKTLNGIVKIFDKELQIRFYRQYRNEVFLVRADKSALKQAFGIACLQISDILSVLGEYKDMTFDKVAENPSA